MVPGRDTNKELTTTTGEGLSNSSTSSSQVVNPPRIIVASPGNVQYQGEDDSAQLISGPGAGDIISGSEPNPQRWGYQSPSGSRIEVNDGAGQERIDIIHRSGSSYIIEPDGSLYMSTHSQRGGGFSAPYGDYFISAGGNIVINGGASISVDTPGDFTLKVGGTLFVDANDISLKTGNMEEVIDGSKSSSVKNDFSSIIGGIKRDTVAGDARFQVSGQYIEDIGADKTQRSGGNTTTSTGGNMSSYAGGDSNITAAGNSTVHSGGNLNLTGTGTTTVYSGGAVKLTGSEVNASPYVDLALWADNSDKAETAMTAGVIGVAIPPDSKPTVSAGTAGSAGEASEVEVAEANDIIDSLTSERMFPEYPGNAVTEHASVAGLGMITYDTMPGAQGVYNAYSGGNQGNWNPTFNSSPVTILPDSPVNRDPNITPVTSNQSAPPSNALGTKISKHFTLGQIINGTTTSYRPPASQWDTIVGRGIDLANNVLDPIKERFPDIVVTSWYRTNSSNHVTGRAIDIVVQSRSTSKHAEIARFARDNLPVDQVFLEKNTSGRTHVHLRLATGSGNPQVMTCGDPYCSSRTAGINVEYLVRRGAPNT